MRDQEIDGMKQRVVNVTDLVENQRLGRFFWNVMAWCLLVSLGDGYDYTAMAYAAPAVIKAMHVERGAMGSVFGAGLFGIMLGSMMFGYVGDRLGRKRAIVIGCLFFGVLTFATMFARSLDALLYLRFVAGLGIGGAVPNAIALISEYSPRRYRATMVTVMFVGFLLGTGGGGYVAAGLVPSFGWQSVFFVGGVIPVLTGLACIFALPESIRLLALQQKNRKELAALAQRMRPALAIDADTQFVLAEERHPKPFTIPLLFSGDRRVATPLLWLLYIANSLALFFLSSWMPVLLESAGLPPGHAALAGSLFSIGGLIGSLAIMRFTDKYGAIAITLLPLLGIPIVAALGLPGTTELFLLSMVFLAGGCTSGAQSGIHSVAGMFYPVSYRANGVGWALSIAKIGSIAGPVIGGMLLSQHLPLQKLFLAAAAPLVVVLLSCIMLGWVYLTRFAKEEAVVLEEGTVMAD
jgi:AAHS family 4-hydroxybenzoate transporter-like MFS transporter